MAVLPRTDVHRHLWAPDLLAALARRSEAPCARRRDGTWWLQVAGEPASAVPAQDPGECAAALGEQGVDCRLESRGAPLFVHPGPVADDVGAAPWWPAVTGYTASLQAAWWAWAAVGLARHPRLRVVFAALAGLAPLHGERAASRGGPPVPDAPQLFYDTSSYGPQAVAMMRRAVGAAQLVHGTDAPVLAAAVAPDDEALLRANPARLLG